MKSAPIFETENERLKTLLAYDLLDTASEIAFDDLTDLASKICGTKIAAITLIDRDRQWFKSVHGLDAAGSEIPRDISLCGHTIHETEVFVIPDATQDERFSDNPVVTGELSVRFYAGAQLFAPNGFAIGALCVIDSEPRDMTQEQKDGLTRLARQVMAQIELRSMNRKLSSTFRELQETSKAVIDYQRKLAETSRLVALENMSSGLAHEINNPLSIVLGRAELLLEQIQLSTTVDKAKAESYLNTIIKTCQRMVTIVNGLRIFARDVSNEPMVLSSTKTIVEETMSLCSARLLAAGIELRVDVEDRVLKCRPVQISQILINLLNNAYDAVAGAQGQRWVHVTCKDHGGGALLSVTDSGSGIPASVAEKIMQPFYTTKEPGKGTGLGLSISAGLAQSHGGRLSIDSSCANTKFDLFLPTSGLDSKSTAA